MKYPPSKSGQMPLEVKKSYSFWLRLMAHCSSESMKKNMNEFSAYLITGIRRVITPLLMTQLFFARSASFRYIESMRLALIFLLGIGSLSFAQEIIPDNFGGYLSVDKEDGLEERSVFISSPRHSYIGEMDEDGDFVALGRRGGETCFGKRVGRNAVIVLRTPVDQTE